MSVCNCVASRRAFTGLETSARASLAAAAACMAASRASKANRASDTCASRAAFAGETRAIPTCIIGTMGFFSDLALKKVCAKPIPQHVLFRSRNSCVIAKRCMHVDRQQLQPFQVEGTAMPCNCMHLALCTAIPLPLARTTIRSRHPLLHVHLSLSA